MSIFSVTNIRNKRQFREEKSLYVVEPIVQYAASWMNISDVTEIEKSKILFFDELKGKELYAKDVRVDENTYWKTYIVDNEYVNIVYLPAFALNPVEKKR